MALATNTTLGSVVLGGDLTGVANAPELRVTGVIPGTYFPANIITDAKGRIIWAKNANWTEDLLPLVEDATYISKGIVQVYETEGECNPQLLLSGGVLTLNMQDASTTQYGKVRIDGTSCIEIVEGNIVKVKYATTGTKGIMQPGVGLDVVDGVLQLGEIQVGEKGVVSIESGGGILVTDGSISLDTDFSNAMDSHLGLVQVGSGLTITNGVMSWVAPADPVASKSVKGYVQVGENITLTGTTISLPLATTTTKGVVQIGDGLASENGSVTLMDASYTSKGLARVATNTGINITSGVISAADASTSIKGRVQVGTNIDVSGGEISIKTATTSVLGVASVGGNIDVTDGMISIKTGSATDMGVVITGANITNNAGTISIPNTSSSDKGVMQVGSGLSETSGIVSVANTILRRNITTSVTAGQAKAITTLTGSPFDWNATDGNIMSMTLGSSATLNNGTNVTPNTYYHFIIDATSLTGTMYFGTQFKFKDGSQTHPVGSKSVLSCYAVDSNTLYCIMQPNFV